ncbi:hypothetical protein EBU99_11415 [bacterium]|nr:hypothetical protein [bacterium]
MSVLASSFRRSGALIVFAVACTTTSGAETAHERAVQQNNKRPGEIRIAPPPGSQESAVRKKREQVEQLLTGDSGTETGTELKLPASVMGLQPGDVTGDPLSKSREQARMQRTDAEIAAISGAGEYEKKLGEVDSQLDVSEESNRPMTPSYTLMTQKIRDLFHKGRFEDALVEVNDLLLHYPKSALLWTMKGTLHLRLSQNSLSLAAYERAFEIEPSQKLQSQIEDLRRLASERESLRRQRSEDVPSESSEDESGGQQQ